MSTYIAIILGGIIMTAGGVLHVFYKNRQIQVSREIESINRNIEQCRLDTRTTDMRMDQLLNRFVIRKQIAENGTSLRPIPLNVIEEVDSGASGRHSVASAAP
ncbi:hypothetical protein JIN84_02000 [Luteolibacter yonseiensis]|uniref:Uncharacterized protein n=1 Tax=Luteolibacter yonseiensis TaxID=1144680 RepID=A0A934R112_9BACT|nr:hypothetical protein [Luteolibacter yonseiensis]MBK1814366.1 hypothetical protein [Luteolibacter yonseiensis]